MGEGEVKDSLGEEPLFTDEHGNVFFHQEESDYSVRKRIKEKKRLEGLKNLPHKLFKRHTSSRITHSPIDDSSAMRGIGENRFYK